EPNPPRRREPGRHRLPQRDRPLPGAAHAGRDGRQRRARRQAGGEHHRGAGHPVMMLDGFKKFILRGNVVDMAVGEVIGAAFATVVSAFTKDLLTPLIAAVVGRPDFSALAFTLNGSTFAIGDFVNAMVSFLLVAAVVYYFVVTPLNALVTRVTGPAP